MWVQGDNQEPPTSWLVEAFQVTDEHAADAIVLRGYLGQSDILQRARKYLERAKENQPEAAYTIDDLLEKIAAFPEDARKQLPWRLYLTPQLDHYVDFHLSSLIAYRQEPKTERQDTYTVWLKAFGEGNKPIPYRVIQESVIGPSFAAYLGGDLIDDYLGETGSVGSAWGDQSAFGRKPGTGTVCGAFGRKPRTGTVCGG